MQNDWHKLWSRTLTNVMLRITFVVKFSVNSTSVALFLLFSPLTLLSPFLHFPVHEMPVVL